MDRKLHLFSLLVCAMFSVQAAAYDFMVDGIAYTKTSANTVEVTHDDSYKSLTHLDLVATVTNAGKTYTVTSIGWRAFQGCNNISGELVIPSTITTIGPYAFSGCSGLTGTLVIPSSVTTLDWDPDVDQMSSMPYAYTFSRCSNIQEIVIGDGLSSLPWRTFSGCNSVKKVTIGKNIREIGAGAFGGFNSLTKIVWNSTQLLHVEAYWYNDDAYNEDYESTIAYLDVADQITELELGEDAKYVPWDLIEPPYSSSQSNLRIIKSNTAIPPSFLIDTWNGGRYGDFVSEVYENAVLLVPPGYKSVYQSADGWKKFKNIEEIAGDIRGDINGDGKVDPTDWNLMWDFIKGNRTPTAGEKTAADLNNDGTINATDATLLENLIKTMFDMDVTAYRGRGDVDGNGKLNTADANIIKSIAQERASTVPSGQPLADVNGDGKVDGWDYFIVLKVIDRGWTEPYDLDDDGAVNPHDWDLLIDFIQQWQEPDEAQEFIADYNRDGKLDMADADRLQAIILQKYPFNVSRYRGAGDVDGNGRINQADANIIKDIILGNKQFSVYPKADVDRNGMVNGMDYFIVLLMVQNGWTELYGDVNGDGKVDPDDWNLILAIMSGDYQGPIDIFRADIDGNGTVDMSDLYALEFQIINNHPIDVARYRGRGDVDGNGVIEVADYNLISGYLWAYDKNQYVQRHPDFDLDRADVKLDGNIDGWDYFIVRFLIINGWTDPTIHANLSVQMPSNTTDGRYKDMYIEVSSTDGTMHNRCVITDKTSYSFNVLPDVEYNVAVMTALGVVLGEKNVEVNQEDVTVRFSSLLQPQTVSMAVTLPDGEDVTDRTAITWTDEQGEFLAQSKMLPGLVQGMKLGYELKLPQDLALQYVQPDRTPYQVKSSGNSILLKLQPFGVATISGTVRDASTSLPLRSSTVTVTQTLNGKQSRSFVAQTDNQGQFGLDVLTAPGQLTVAAQGYVSRTYDLPTVSGTMRLDTLRLSPITGAVIRTDLTYRASVKQGETATTLNYYEDYANVSYTLRNKTRNRDITRFSVQFPDIVLLEDVNEGDEIVITAHSIKGVFNDAEASCVVHANRASVTLPLVELGGIEAHYTQSQAGSVVGMLYDNTGEQVRRDRYADATLSLAYVPDGRYTLVTMQASDYLNTVLTLGGLTEAGLKAGTDYTTKAVTVTSGKVTEVGVDAVPALDESQLYYTSRETRFTAGRSSVTIGNYVTLTANVGFKSDYQSRVSDVQLVIDLPQGCDFVEQSLMIGDDFGGYYREGNRLTVALPREGGLVKFCAFPTSAGRVAPSAAVQFKVGGKKLTQLIGAANFEAKELAISVPSTVAEPEVNLSGSAPVGSTIEIYDNGDLIGTTTTVGTQWSATCALPYAYNLSCHPIYAKATTRQGVQLLSETASCLYNKYAIEVSKVTMYYSWVTRGNAEYIVVFDFIKNTPPVHYTTDMYDENAKFTFTIEFAGDASSLRNVKLHVKTLCGNWKTLDAKYDENQKVWVAVGEFGDAAASDYPVNVAVSYDKNPYSSGAILELENAQNEDVIQKTDSFYEEAASILETSLHEVADDGFSFAVINSETEDSIQYRVEILDFDEIYNGVAQNRQFNYYATEEGLQLYDYVIEGGMEYAIYVDVPLQLAFKLYSTYVTKDSRRKNPIIVLARAALGLYALAQNLKTVGKIVQYRYMTREGLLAENNRSLAQLDDMINKLQQMLNQRCEDGSMALSEDYRAELRGAINDCIQRRDWLSNSSDAYMDRYDRAFRDLWNMTGTNAILQGLMGPIIGRLAKNASLAKSGIIDFLKKHAGPRQSSHYVNNFLNNALNAAFSNIMEGTEKIMYDPEQAVLSEANKYLDFVNNKSNEIYLDLEKLVDNAEAAGKKCKKGGDDNTDDEPRNPNWHHSGCPDVTFCIEPGGFVYEAVPSNRLQGVTASIYYKETVEDMFGLPQEHEVLWNAEDFGQINPQITDEQGVYSWDTPAGMWQVRLVKNGYEPTQSEWLPVPPPQLDVNIGMTQLRQPDVAMVHAYKDGVELTFDKYMRPATLTTDNIAVTQSGKAVAGTVELMNEEQGDAEALASKVKFVPSTKFATDQPVTLTVKRQVESYAGVQMNSDFTQTFDIEKQVRVIAIDSVVNVGYGESRQVLVQALPVDIAKGKTLRVRSNLPVISDVEDETYTLDKHGRANITVNGNLPGAATLTLSVDGFDLCSRARVMVVDEASLVTAKPVASVVNGKVFDGPLTVELSCETPGATIYYTTDGSCPCDVDRRKVYSGPITINETTTLKAIAASPNHYESDIATYYYFYASGVKDVQGGAPFTVAPTLVTDGFKVLGVTGGADVRLYSMKGNEVLHRPVVRSGELVPMSHLAPDIYIVVVTIDGRPYARRVVKVQ